MQSLRARPCWRMRCQCSRSGSEPARLASTCSTHSAFSLCHALPFTTSAVKQYVGAWKLPPVAASCCHCMDTTIPAEAERTLLVIVPRKIGSK